MSDILMTVPKIGTGTDDDSIRPDTNAGWWEVVEERETEFVIRVKG